MHKRIVLLLASALILGSFASCRNTADTESQDPAFASGFNLSGSFGVLESAEKTSVQTQDTQARYEGYQSVIIYHNGNLKSLKEYDGFGNLVTDQDYGNNGYVYKYIYDIYGNLTKEIKFGVDGQSQGGYEYEYDASGKQIKKTYLDASEKPGLYHEYTYDPNGNLLKDTEFTQEGEMNHWTVYAYDHAGNLVTQTQTEANGDSYVVNNEYEYDASGNVTKCSNYRGGEANGWTEYAYDAQGNTVSEKVYKPDGSIKSWCEYTYDADCNMMSKTVYKEDGSIFQKTIYEYYGGLISVETKLDEEGEIMDMYQYVYD